MRTSLARSLLTALLILLLAPAVMAGVVHHALEARLDPGRHQLAVTDRVTLPDSAPDTVVFRLHAGLEPRLIGQGATLARLQGVAESPGVPTEAFRVSLAPGVRTFTVAYQGEIHHPVADLGEEYARSFSISPGLIGSEGVFLAGSSHWIPELVDMPYLSFELSVALPERWRSVSQGRRTRQVENGAGVHETWAEDRPQEEIYLVAARFSEYRQPGATADAVVFLREPDEALAGRYLELTGRYLDMYQRLIGAYPYAKFALVENFWETGYGMPSFTLLGPRVIRLPFIPYTSYPHEILHNWWGNGVYVDYASGNWAEGLTSYLADHLLKEQRGQGDSYRRAALQKYADYVHENRDFALNQFRGRHSSVTEAVGYGKTLMVFHMLRRELGDREFVAGLRRLYADQAFRVAAWSDVAEAFGAATGRSLQAFFEQWITRPGAPELRLGEVEVEATGEAYRLRAVLEQTQDGPAFSLEVPVAIQLQGQEHAVVERLAMRDKRQSLDIELPARPLRVAVDPGFDLFRRLHREEIPPAISQALGGERVLMVLPSAAPEPLREAYRRLAESWQRGRTAGFEIRTDDTLDALPKDRVVWLLGWQNRFRAALTEALARYEFAAAPERVTVAGETLQRGEHAIVVLARHPDNPDQAIAWVAAENLAAMPGLARKLPHYGKYSYLGFAGDEPENVLKGQWPVSDSPLSATLVDRDVPALALAPRKALAELPPAFSAARMLQDVARLADPALQGRGLGSTGLDTAGDYIAAQFRQIGLEPAGDGGGSYFQAWQERSGQPAREMTLRNVLGMIRGADAGLSDQVVVVGAHYDHLGLGWPDVRHGHAGSVHPGADDNASGVAVLLELARALAAGPAPRRSILFVAFTAEEADRLGSRHFVAAATKPDRDSRPFAMVNLDTVGRLGEGPLYVLGAESAREWVHIFRGAGYVTGTRVEVVTEPLDSSDQRSFIEAGIPAVQLFSGAHEDYHRPSDTLDKLDARGLARVAAVAREAIDYLAGPDGRLTAAGLPAAATPARSDTPRRAALGTVPDFAWSGEGVRLSGVNPGSPAEAAGLRAGDIVLAVNGDSVATLRAYADLLGKLAPGAAVAIRFLRRDEVRSVELIAVER